MPDIRFQKIDPTNIADHPRLGTSDECYFLFEYTSGRGYSFSPTNQLIANLKKKPHASAAELGHKRRAIRSCSAWLTGAINAEWLRTATLVPTPPSKVRGHADYDDRLVQICQGISPGFPVDVRELVVQRESMQAAHEAAAGVRPSLADLINLYSIDESKATPAPRAIAIIDDVLTAATHYRAMHTVLSARFASVPIVAMALLTGLRRGNVLALDWSEIDLRQARITVRVKSRRPQGRIHSVAIVPEAAQLLRLLAPRAGDRTGPVFRFGQMGCDCQWCRDHPGEPIKGIKRAFRTARRAAGLDQLRFHDLRHTVASALINRGADLHLVQKVLGHADAKTTRRYAHLADHVRAQALARGVAGFVAPFGANKAQRRASRSAK